MRGYRYLKQEGKLHIIEDTVQHLRKYQLKIPISSLPKVLWGHALNDSEIIARQRLASRYLVLTRAILIAAAQPQGNIIAPFPKAWRDELQRLGFHLDQFRSSFAWNLYLIQHVFYGIYKAIKALKSFVFVRGVIPVDQESYLYFCDLAPSNIPSTDAGDSSYCIVSWYSSWSGRRSDIKSLRHSVLNSRTYSVGTYDLLYQQFPVHPLTSIAQRFSFILFLLSALIHILVAFCKHHWWNIIIFHESIMSLLVRLQSTPLAKEYWFHNSRFYPPLWTYELPLKGSKCIYYFYSMNCESVLFRKDGSRPFVSPYSIMNWPEYLAWADSQREFIRRCCGYHPRITIVGTIHFSDKSISFPRPVSEKVFAVFDVQPFRDSFYRRFGFASEFYVPDQCIAFFEDILSVASDLNATLMVKRKRDIGSAAHPLYSKYIALMASSENVIFVDSGCSAKAVMKHSIGTISMPFTSTAFTSREMGLPSIYYVPSNVRDVDFSLSHGLQVISGKSGLRSWMKAVLSEASTLHL